MEPVDNADLEGPKVDRRTVLDMFSKAGLVGAVGGLAGCGQSDSSGGSPTDDASTDETTEDQSGGDQSSGGDMYGGSVEAGVLINEIATLDPHYSDEWVEVSVFSNVFSGIVKLNPDNEIVGDAASDWTISDDGTTYEFDIREGIQFHNGDALDASAIKWSLERVMNADDSPHQGNTQMMESIEAPDETTLRITLDEPTAPFLAYLTRGPGRIGAIVNQTAVEEQGDQYGRSPVGSGPFEMGEWNAGESIQLTRFDDYWESDDEGNQLPYLDEVVFNFIPEPSTLWSAFQADDIQYAGELPPQNAQRAEQNDAYSVKSVDTGSYMTVTLLCNDPQEGEWRERQEYASGNSVEEVSDRWQEDTLYTKDPKVRRAIGKAIDREDFVEKGYMGYAEPAHSLIPPTVSWAYEEEPDPGYYYDPEGARELLDEAGLTGDPRFSMRLLGKPDQERIMTVIQEHLRQVGIEVELNIMQDSAYGPERYLFTHMSFMNGTDGIIDPVMAWWNQLKTPQEEGTSGSWNKALWSNPEFDEAVEQSYRTPDPEERLEYVKQAEALAVEGAQYVAVAFPKTPIGSTPSLNGVQNPVALHNFHEAYLD